MEFPLAKHIATDLIVLETVASTNDYLSARSGEESVAEFTVVVTTTQTAGRGRLDRAWEAPPGTSLAVSVLLHPHETGLHSDLYGWLPLAAGLAMSRAVQQLVPERNVTVKWPNDVLVDGKKVCGILCELSPQGSVVVGAGVNLTIPNEALPVPHATSLMLMGAVAPAEELADLVLATYLRELKLLWELATSADPLRGLHDIRRAVSDACSTLGMRIRLSLPDGTEEFGTALDLDEAGRLRMRRNSDGTVQSVAAGDVTHLRYE